MPSYLPYTWDQLSTALLEIRGAIYTIVGQIDVTAWRTKEPVLYPDRQSGEELHLKVGDKWGDLFDCAWFRFRGEIPAAAARQPVVALLDVNGEMCVVDDAGVPVRGLTHISLEYNQAMGGQGKRVLPLADSAAGGEQFEIWADAGCNDLFGRIRNNGTLREAAVALFHPEIRDLFYDFEVLLDSIAALPEHTARMQQILVALNDAVHLLNGGGLTDESVARMRKRLAKELGKGGGDPSLEISAIGHAHLDLAWLWPLRETKRKGVRTFATAVAQMDQYPDYLFAASQAQLYAWIKELQPVLYARIKDRVAERRIEPQGALWVENDTNLVSGESWIRQILYGRRFFRVEFGVDVDYVWLPDTFGFSASVPHILASAGIRRFVTQKISWSLINAFPHQSFHWQGIDGNTVLVHMPPEEEYSSRAAPTSLAKIESNYRDRGVSGHALLAFGIGDGGGGPGEEHLQRLARLKNFAGLPPVRQEWVTRFFERLEAEAGGFATWVGEMYLERHEGTLTTNARNKMYNRLMERLLREWEWLAALAHAGGISSYPSARLLEIWHEVLLYQFHDILPGSSIKRVYDETDDRYDELEIEVTEAIRETALALAAQVDTTGVDAPVIVFNSLSWERAAWLRFGSTWQRVSVPPLGYTVVSASRAGEETSGLVATTELLENELLAVSFDASGAITSVFDKVNGREVIALGAQANRLAVYRDLGDAWDFPMDYAASEPRYMQLSWSRAEIDGPRAVLRQEYRLGYSELTQQIILETGRPYIEFATSVTWRETATMLRSSFPLALHPIEALSETQFGYVRRPLHRNTSWDLARDETAAQRWVDLAQRDYGVALFNDCKYGHKLKGNVIDINLLRSVPYAGTRLVEDADVAPGQPHHGYTDQTDHLFRYALYPHAGDLVESAVTQKAWEFNYPLRVLATGQHGGPAGTTRSTVWLSSLNVVVEAVKKAEDSDALIIRLYESSGSDVQSRIRVDLPVERIEQVNSMEDPIRDLEINDNTAELRFHPFEIMTLRITYNRTS